MWREFYLICYGLQIICYRPKMDMLPVVKKLKNISESKESREVSD